MSGYSPPGITLWNSKQTHEADKVYFSINIHDTTGEGGMLLLSTFLASFWCDKQLFCQDITNWQELMGEVYFLCVHMYVWLHIWISGIHTVSFQGGVLNDNDTHPFVATGWTHHNDQSAGDTPWGDRHVLYMLGWEFGITRQVFLPSINMCLSLIRSSLALSLFPLTLTIYVCYCMFSPKVINLYKT